jgi:hypothetical protein
LGLVRQQGDHEQTRIVQLSLMGVSAPQPYMTLCEDELAAATVPLCCSVGSGRHLLQLHSLEQYFT